MDTIERCLEDRVDPEKVRAEIKNHLEENDTYHWSSMTVLSMKLLKLDRPAQVGEENETEEVENSEKNGEISEN